MKTPSLSLAETMGPVLFEMIYQAKQSINAPIHESSAEIFSLANAGLLGNFPIAADVTAAIVVVASFHFSLRT